MSPEALAQAAAQAMWDADLASRELGLTLDQVAPGYARLSLRVTEAMLNGHQTCHGGYIFLLADSAFAFACNSFNTKAVAQHCSIFYLQPGQAGDQLTAEAALRSQAGRSGIYDVRVSRQDGGIIAEFRGYSRTVGGVHVNPH